MWHPLFLSDGRAFGLRLFVVASLLATTGCSTLGFYHQAVVGQVSLLANRTPLDEVIADPRTDDSLRDKLLLVQEVRAFAEQELGLPVGDTFSSYVDTGRNFVVWNVFAADEFSTRLETFCYPIAGCVSYRGYFNEQQAREFGQSLAAEGFEVFVGGVAAYSTLGWFADPVLNTFVARDDVRLAALLFHELAHKALYLPGDTQFNESFATALERQALKQWLSTSGSNRVNDTDAFAGYLDRQAREEAVISLIGETRTALEALYASDLPAMQKRVEKAKLIDSMRARYEALQSSWPTGNEFQAWMQGDINNARMGTVADYHGLVPAFDEILRRQDGDIQGLIDEATRLSELEPEARELALQALAQHGDTDAGNHDNAK